MGSMDKNDRPEASVEIGRREALLAGAATSLLAVSGAAVAADGESQAVGPFLGHVDHQTALIWYRAATSGEYRATITDTQTGESRSVRVTTAAEEHDLLCDLAIRRSDRRVRNTRT